MASPAISVGRYSDGQRGVVVHHEFMIIMIITAIQFN